MLPKISVVSLKKNNYFGLFLFHLLYWLEQCQKIGELLVWKKVILLLLRLKYLSKDCELTDLLLLVLCDSWDYGNGLHSVWPWLHSVNRSSPNIPTTCLWCDKPINTSLTSVSGPGYPGLRFFMWNPKAWTLTTLIEVKCEVVGVCVHVGGGDWKGGCDSVPFDSRFSPCNSVWCQGQNMMPG